MKFLHYILIAFLALSFAGCSDKDHEPEPPMEMETQPMSKILNEDGTYYALHRVYFVEKLRRFANQTHLF